MEIPFTIITHPDAVWRDRADHVLNLTVESERIREQVWGRLLSNGNFELCCIPFFAYNYSLGDEVAATDYQIQSVVQESGRYVFRVMLVSASDAPSLQALLAPFETLIELNGTRLYAIDVPNEAIASELSGVLLQAETEGWLHYETGRS